MQSEEKIKIKIIGVKAKNGEAENVSKRRKLSPSFSLSNSIRGSPFHRPLIIDYLGPIRAHC